MRWCLVQSFAAALLLSFGLCHAGASESVAPGEYVRSGDSGWLKVERRDNKTVFSLDSIGGNCHTCSVSGLVVGTIGQSEDETLGEEEMVCRIRMAPSRGGQQLEIEPLTEEACRQFCGMRAGFDGTYRKPPKLCTRVGQRKASDLFIRHYRSKQYRQAIAALLPVLERCSEFLNWIEVDRVRNDLALAYLHGGSADQCLKTLKDTKAASYADEETLRGALPPCDFDSYVPTAQATWHNMRLCSDQRAR